MRSGWLISFAFFTLLGCSDVRESSFSSYADAEKSSVIEQGWIPEELPLAATNIRELHNIDTNEGWGRFELRDARQLASFEQALKCVNISNIRLRRFPRRDWWPSFLRETVDLTNTPEMRGFRCTDERRGNLFFVINRPTNTVFFFFSRYL